MSDSIKQIDDHFWNIRGAFRVFGLLNVGTHASLARRSSGKYVLLDSYHLKEGVLEKVLELTDGGALLEAIVNLHPFHTVHVTQLASQFPSALIYGTSRHQALFPSLPWQPTPVQGESFARLFSEDFDFMIPDGVPLVARNENHHFSSVLAFHRATQTLHVDDTLNWIPLPWSKRLAFHPTLKSVLEQRAGAATAFRSWAQKLIERCQSVRNVCTAHARASALIGQPAGTVAEEVRAALEAVEPVLKAHERQYG